MSTQKRAIALISGGLDSMLAAKTVLDQGVHVEGINFYTGFCVEGHTHAIRKKDQSKNKRNNSLWVAEQLGIKLHIIDIVEDYKQVVLNPKHQYGSYLNPCLDCKIFMINKAREWIEENNFDFIITGEVVGQRPKSQTKSKIPIIAKATNTENKILRPLCAKILEPTLPEINGWVDREKLHDFSGRSRSGQRELAEKFGYTGYAQPAGGCCFLTNEHYSSKLLDMWQHKGERSYEIDDIMLLKIGRHLRPNKRFKMIIGREEGENNYLWGYRKQFTALKSHSHTGPLALIDGKPTADDITLAGKILGRYAKAGATDFSYELIQNGKTNLVTTQAFDNDHIKPEWYLDKKPLNKKLLPTKIVCEQNEV
jgi:tRNA-specific 2-thiouridylase